MEIMDKKGQRKYLTPAERDAFLEASNDAERDVRTFCTMLMYAGCRISEALQLTADRIDLKAGVVVFETLKKRTKGIYRQVPIPPAFLDTLDMVHSLRTVQKRPDRGKGIPLWAWSRTTAWRRVVEVMKVAKIEGIHATPKGLRHGFGIRAVTRGVPLNKVQKWMGHAQLSTTSIYTDAIGEEEQQLAERMWTDD